MFINLGKKYDKNKKFDENKTVDKINKNLRENSVQIKYKK